MSDEPLTQDEATRAVRDLSEADYRVLFGLCGLKYKRYNGAADKREACERLSDKGLLFIRHSSKSKTYSVTMPPVTYTAVDLRG